MEFTNVVELLIRAVVLISTVVLIVWAVQLSKRHKNPTTYKKFVHPELLPGEMWLMNIWVGEETFRALAPAEKTEEEEQSDSKATFEGLPYKLKRLGNTAYTTAGFPLTTEMRPVFVDITEYHEHQKQIRHL